MGFICDKCGVCCQNLKMSSLYRNLDRGDGTCKYLSEAKLCTIYDSRPDICNVDKGYELFFEKIMSKDEYYAMNYLACKELKKQQ